MNLHNTLSGSPSEIDRTGPITFYSCGLTVYSQPHIGNWVAYIYWDLLQRVLIETGHEVVRVQNITDVGHLTDDGDAGEDKMQKGALKEGKTAWDVAEKYIGVADDEAYEKLGLLRPTHMPRATDYIDQQIEFVRTLEAGGFAYVIDDGVYFDTSKLSDYGKLAKLDIDGLQFGARVADTGKRNPTDFALWKFSPSSEIRDMEWDSPWGTGFPGWHLECSVMARELLGDTIDIHTGGIDHIPVHHTNEIAQSEAVTGKPFARVWVHANHIKVDGTKMSKSLGNIITLDDILERGYDLNAFKLLVLAKHYRTEGNFTWDIMQAAQNRWNRWKNIAALRHQIHDTLENDDDKDSQHDLNGRILAAPHALKQELSSDLNSPVALRTLEELFDQIESAQRSSLQRSAVLALLEAIEALFGLRILEASPDISKEAKQLIIARATARAQKDWQTADRLRDHLRDHFDVIIRDTVHGQVWEYAH